MNRENVAVITEKEQLSYGQLKEETDRIASVLEERTVAVHEKGSRSDFTGCRERTGDSKGICAAVSTALYPAFRGFQGV